MALDIETIGLAVDTDGIVRGKKALDGLNDSADKASRKADDVSSSYSKQASVLQNVQREMQKGASYQDALASATMKANGYTEAQINHIQELTREVNGMKGGMEGASGSIMSMAKGFLTVTAAIAGLREAMKVMDEFTKYSAILKNATATQVEYNNALSDVKRIANAAQTDIASIAQVYARFSNSLKEFGATQSQVSMLTETVTSALKANGATAGETSAAMIQLSQAFGKGRINGDEFNSMAENAPPLMRALAASMGVANGELKDLAAAGKITADEMLKAWSNPELLATYQQQAKEVRTISGEWQVFKNEVSSVVSNIGSSSGVVDFVTGSIRSLTTAMRGLNEVLETGRLTFNSWLPSYEKYRRMRDKDTAEFKYATRIDQAIAEGGFEGLKTAKPSLSIMTEEEIKAADKAQKKVDAAAKKSRQDENAEILKDLQNQIDLEMELGTVAYNKQLKEIQDLFNEEDAYEQINHKRVLENAAEEYKLKMKQVDLLSKQAEQNYNEAQKAAKKAADDLEKEYERINNNLSRSLTDAIFRGFEKGKSFIDNFIDTLKNAFKTLVLQPAIQFLVDASGITKLLAGVGSIFSTDAAASAAGSGSFFDKGLKLVDAITGGFKQLNTGFSDSIQSLGAYLSNGNGGLADKIGGFMGEYGVGISKALGYAGAALAGFNYLKDGNYIGAGLTAAGAAFGGPAGAAIGAAIGSLFGGKVKTKKYSTGVTGNYSNGQFTSSNQSGLAGYGKALGGNEGLASVLKDYSTVVSGLFGAFGMNGDVNTSASMFQRSSKKTRAWGYFGANAGGGSVNFSSGDQAFGSAQEAMSALIEKILTEGITGLVATSNLPEGIRALFDGLGDKASIQAMINASINIANAQEALIKQYNLTADTAGKVAVASGYAGEQLAQFANALATTALSSQKTSITIMKERDALKELIGSLPDSVTAFDAILKSINATTADGQKQFADLFELRDRFTKYTSAFDGVVNNVESAIYGLLSPSEKMALDQANLAKAFAELNLSVPTSITELIALGKSIDYGTEAGLDLALAFPALVSMFNQTETAAKSLSDTLSANYFSTRADFMSAKASNSPQSYIKNQAQMNTEMLAEIKKLQQDGADTKAVMLAVAEYTAKFQRTIDDWDSEGMPAVRESV